MMVQNQNGSYPQGYRPQIPYQPQYQNTQNGWNNYSPPYYPQGLSWVTEQEAMAYNPPSGAATALWDKDKPIIYLKTLDEYGRPSTEIYRYEKVSPVDPNTQNFVSKEEFATFTEDLRLLKESIQPLLNLTNGGTQKGGA